MYVARLLVSTRSPLTGPAVTLSVTSLLSASVGMVNPVTVTSCVLPASMLAMDAVCLMVLAAPPGRVSVAVTGTFFSVTLPWFWTWMTKERSGEAGTSLVRPRTSLRSPELPWAVTSMRATPWMPESLDDLPTLSSARVTVAGSSAFHVR